MRNPLAIAILTAVYALVAAIYRPPRYAILDPIGTVLWILYYPVTLTAVFLLIVGLWVAISKPPVRQVAILLCILSLPMPALAAYQISSHINQRRSDSWPTAATIIGDQLLDYYERHPEAFHFRSADEEVSVTGFGEYLRHVGDAAVPRGWAMKIRTKGDQVLDPWGKPLLYGLDRDGDGYIQMQGERVLTSGINPPNLDYRVAVAVSLGHKDNGSYRALARRR